MRIYDRNYLEGLQPDEIKKYKEVLMKEGIKDNKRGGFGKKNLHYEYPEAVRHYNSLFPNNHIELFDWKQSGKMTELINEFDELIHNRNTRERDVLSFINHKPAHFIICSLLSYKNFGHHKTYIFPEFSIGNGKYFADYLIVGKNSGGYEFVYVELEAPNGKSTLVDGHDGLANRKGLNQISDWKRIIMSDYNSITNEFAKSCKDSTKLPTEFRELDVTRIHYMVISGLREHYNDVSYYERRSKAREQQIEMYHYDNLIDLSRGLEEKITF